MRPFRNFLLCLVLGLPRLAAQEPTDIRNFTQLPVRTWTEDHGLSQPTVQALAKDGKGYVWVGTQDGLYRFNGRNLERIDPPGKPVIPSIRALLSASDGSLWIGRAAGGLSRLQGDRWTHFPVLAQQTNPSVNALVETPGRRLFVGTRQGLFRREGEAWIRQEGLQGDVLCLAATGQGALETLWVGSSEGLGRLERGAWRWFRREDGLPGSQVLSLASSRSGLWVGTDRGLVKWENSGFAPPPRGIRPPAPLITALQEVDSAGGPSLWVGTAAGLGIWEGGRWRVLDRHSRLPSPSIGCLWVTPDPGPGLRGPWEAWIGTEAGLARIQGGPWCTVAPVLDRPLGMPIPLIEAPGRALWIGSTEGLFRFQDGAWTALPGLDGRRIMSLHAEGQRLWIGGWHGGVHRLEGGRFQALPPIPYAVRAFLRPAKADGRGLLWIGTEHGPQILRGDRWESLTQGGLFPDVTVTRIQELADGDGIPVLLLATAREGIARYRNGAFSWLPRPPGLEDWHVFDFQVFKDGAGAPWLWAGGRGSGLHRARWRGDPLQWERVSLGEPGQAHPVVYTLQQDDRGRIYVFTSGGVVRLTPQAGSEPFRRETWTHADGLPADDCNIYGSLIDSGGRIWTSTIKGLAVFDPRQDVPDEAPKPLHLESFSAGGAERPRAGGAFEAKLRDYRLSYALLSYHRPEETRYRTQLVGLEASPTDWSPQPFREFPTLPSGRYVFKVWGRDYAGNLSGPVALSFRVLPPFWLSPWALLAYLLGAAGSVGGLVRWRSAQLVREKQALEALVRERTATLERTNAIVKSINEQVDFDQLLHTILEETRVIRGVEKASALVRVQGTDLFRCRAALGWGPDLSTSPDLSLAEAEARYVHGAEEVFEDVFLIRGNAPLPGHEKFQAWALHKALMVLRIRIEGSVEGYLVFDNLHDENAFDGSDLDLLKGLREHFVSAFRKARSLELDQARARAEAEAKAKGEFLANMSHEIRTPMNAVIGFAHLGLKLNLEPRPRDYFQKIANASQSLLGIINDILDFTKIEAGRMELERIPFRVGDVLGQVADLVSPKASEKGVELLVSVAEEVPESLLGDPLRLGQVLMNLSGNAIKFTERGQVLVRVEVAHLEGRTALLRFQVKDSGIGMGPEALDRLFHAFTQADTSTTRRFGGTGLGLVISKRLLDLMGGEISVESALGRGSTFTITVPFELAETQPEPRRGLRPELWGLKVLVVDDNPTARQVFHEQVRSLGFEVTSVASGMEALMELERAEGFRAYDLVLMDWRLEGVDGVETARRIHRNLRLAHVPTILLMTAFGREEAMRNAEQAGIQGFIAKPVNPDLLMDAILEAMGRGQEPVPIPKDPESVATVQNLLAGARVLLAEDNPINQEVATEILSAAGIQVEVAGDGVEAVRRAGEADYDAILMDVQMPVMDGKQATQRIREQPRNRNLPIIAMTAHAMAGYREECLAAGMDDYLSKPIDPQNLFEILSRWIKGRASVAPEPKPPTPKEGPAADPAGAFDLAAGLRRVGGNRAFYLRLVGGFATDFARADEEIRAALLGGDLAQAEHLAHTLKGVAGNLSAVALAQATAPLETALRARNAEGARQALPAFEAALARALAAAPRLADALAPPAEVRP